jgi:HK97 family phage major capsid protein
MANIFKAIIEATDSAGGYTVPDEFASRVLALVQEKTQTIPELDAVSMNTDTFKIPQVTGGNTAYIVPEVGEISGSDASFGQITLSPVKFAALTTASTEVLEDNNVGLANVLVEQMATDIGLKVEDEILNGTGGTGFEGLRYTGSFTNSYSAGNGTTSGVIGVEDISAAMDLVLNDNHIAPDVSFFHTKTIGQLRALTDGSARPLLNMETYGSPLLKEGAVGTIYGMRVKPTNKLPINISYGTASAATASDAILGVAKQFAYYSNRRAINMRQEYKLEYDANAFQMNMRSAFAIKYPNAYAVIRAITDS